MSCDLLSKVPGGQEEKHFNFLKRPHWPAHKTIHKWTWQWIYLQCVTAEALTHAHTHSHNHTLGWTEVNDPAMLSEERVAAVLHHAKTSIFLSALLMTQDHSKNPHHWWNKRRPKKRSRWFSFVCWPHLQTDAFFPFFLHFIFRRCLGNLRIHWH